MDIVDIKRHEHNFKILCKFLKQEKIYIPFKRQLFTKRNLTTNDFFNLIEKRWPNYFLGSFDSHLTHRIDKRWAIIFNYVPYLGGYWGEGDIKNIRLCEMEDLSKRWKEFLLEHNYDKSNKI